MKNQITRTKNTVSATYLPYAAYKSAIALATAHKGEIGKTDKGNFMAIFNSVETAKKFVAEWTAEYEANRKVEPTVAPTPKSTPKAQKPKASKGKAETKPTAKKPKASKGNNLDFTKVKGKTKSERNRNAHALIIAQGVKSGSVEYMALWNEWTNAR